MVETWASLGEQAANGVTLVLDASESARGVSDDILELANSVLQALPADFNKKLFFVGNRTEYEPNSLPYSGGQWMRENQRRGSFINPVFEQIPEGDGNIVLLLHDGSIFDLEDWYDTPIFQQLIAVPFDGHELVPNPPRTLSPNRDEIMRAIKIPIRKVRIFRQGGIPIFWDNAGYRFEEDAQFGMVLEASHAPNRSFAITLGVLGDEEKAPVKAEIELNNGTRRLIELTATGVLSGTSETRTLLDSEKQALMQCLKREDFVCPLCQEEHKYWELICENKKSGFIDSIIYKSLEAFAGEGFTLLQVNAGDNKATARKHRCNVLKIDESRVAIRKDQSVDIYAYDNNSRRWYKSDETFTPYMQTAGGEYAIFF